MWCHVASIYGIYEVYGFLLGLELLVDAFEPFLQGSLLELAHDSPEFLPLLFFHHLLAVLVALEEGSAGKFMSVVQDLVRNRVFYLGADLATTIHQNFELILNIDTLGGGSLRRQTILILSRSWRHILIDKLRLHPVNMITVLLVLNFYGILFLYEKGSTQVISA